MTTMVNRLGGLLQIGQPADFFASERSRQALQGLSLTSVFILACAPFLSWQHLSPITTWQQEFWAFLAGLCVLSMLLRSAGWTRPALSVGIVFPIALAALTLAQSITGRIAAHSVTVLALVEMAWVLALMLSVVQLDRRAVMRAIGLGLIVAGLLGGVLGLIQAARLPALAGRGMFYAQDGLAYGFLAQRNLFADVQFMALLSLSFVWDRPYQAGQANSRTTHLAATVMWGLRILVLSVIAASAADSGSNALFAQFAVALPMILFWRRRDREQSKRLLHDLILALVVIGIVAGSRASAGGPTHVAGVSVLHVLWSQAIHAIAEHPVLGIGLGNTPTVFYAFAASLPQTPMWHAFHAQGWAQVHNLVLQLWLEGGLAGLAIALGLYGALAWGWLRARSAPEIFAASLLTVLLVHSLVEFPLWNLPFLGIAALCLVVILPSRTVRLPQVSALMPVAAIGVMGLAGVLAFQMNARVGMLQAVAEITFNPTQIGTIASVARTLDDARNWTGLTGTLLEPAAVYETAAFSPEIVPEQQRADYLAQLDRTMHLTPVGSIPYARADLIAHLQSVPQGVAALREATQAVPYPARVWLGLLETKARHGDVVAAQLLRAWTAQAKPHSQQPIKHPS